MEALTKPSDIGMRTTSIIRQGEMGKMEIPLLNGGGWKPCPFIPPSQVLERMALEKKRLMFRGTERWRREKASFFLTVPIYKALSKSRD